MYTRTKTFQNKDGSTRTYLQIVQTRRIGNKVRQKVIANLGRLEELQEGSLDRLIEGATRYSLHQWVKLNSGQLAARRARQWAGSYLWSSLAGAGLRKDNSQSNGPSPGRLYPGCLCHGPKPTL